MTGISGLEPEFPVVDHSSFAVGSLVSLRRNQLTLRVSKVKTIFYKNDAKSIHMFQKHSHQNMGLNLAIFVEQ